MNMEWLMERLKLSVIEIAFAVGGIIGIAIGFWAGCSVQNVASYVRGYRRGHEQGRTEDGE